MDALWAGRKDGKTIATLGTYHLTKMDGVERSYADMLAVADTRYGGLWKWIWDGERLLCSPDHLLTVSETDAMNEQLDAYLRAFPDVPEGWDGWYYREKVRAA
ncbi:hypothetical protein CH289_07745 [Rhodococcus sp. RS1C4]|nr:hypothetical protein CH289_07745 [Rhodococcus sp. RS1C4]